MSGDGMPFAGRMAWAISGALFFLFGVALWISSRWRHAAARRWVPTTGQVASASYERFEGESTITYVPTVIYRYAAGDRAFEARRIRLLGTSRSCSADYAMNLVARYAAGTAVTVFHDPHDPAKACLEIDEPTRVAFVIMALASPFWIVALVWP